MNSLSSGSSAEPDALPLPSPDGDSEPATSAAIRLAHALGFNRAVGFAVLARFWQLLSGPVTQFLIVLRFSPSLQDYYYAFLNMLGIQIFVELGLQVVIINVVSHEWARLSLIQGRPEGHPDALSRLASLGRLMLTWYAVAATIFLAGALVSGLLFFSEIDAVRIDGSAAAPAPSQGPATIATGWRLPWAMLVMLNAMQLAVLPLLAILEGCGQMTSINRVRFWQAIAGSLVVWAMIVGGTGLWALVGASLVRLLGDLYLVAGPYRPFVHMIRTIRSGPTIRWQDDILPLQWRMAAQGAAMWFANQMPLLVILWYHPEGEAGRLGMTWTILTALQSASMALVETRRSQFGALIAARRYQELDLLFFRLTRVSMSLLAPALVGFCLTAWWLGTRDEWLFSRLSERLLPVGATVLFSVAFLAYQFTMCTGIYVRAHRRDPFLLVTLVSCLVLAVAEYVLGRRYGGIGVAAGYCLGIVAVQLPLGTLIWRAARREWHEEPETSTPPSHDEGITDDCDEGR